MRRRAPNRRAGALAIQLTALLGVGPTAHSAGAHHAYATFFDLCTRITIEGQVEHVEWKPPHVWLQVTTNHGIVHRAEWTSPDALERSGIRADSIKAGERIVVTGSPFRDPAVIRRSVPAFKGEFLDTTVSALTQVRRPSDGWNWTRASPAIVPGCRSDPTR
jgi:hypothetical protein